MPTTYFLPAPPTFLKLLAHDLRWQLLAALAQSDFRVQELVDRVKRPMNLVSYHLKQLRKEQLVHERRSSADGRDVYYTIDLSHLATLYRQSGAQLHPLLGQSAPIQARTCTESPPTTQRVLFLCTHNSARSQMAEGLLHHLGGSRIEVYSAGNQPAQVHSLAIRTLTELGVDIAGQRAKHLDEFRSQSFDWIITVCDRVREECPVFPGDPHQSHWSIPDPLDAPAEQAEKTFRQVAQLLSTRINYLLLVLDNV